MNLRYLLYTTLCMLAFTSMTANAQVNANFQINYQLPNCAPTVVSFANTSTGSGTLTYAWNFGIVPGVNSTQQNPSTTFPACGTYNVSLTTTNSLGQTSTVVHQVSVDCEPVANFTVSSTAGCSPITVTFNSGASSPGNAASVSYQWDFGDGYGSTQANPTHVYNTPGCKSVTLVITNSNGCIDDTTIQNLICPTPPPTADFTSTNPIGCAYPFNVVYTANASGTNPPFTYQWTFQGGTPATSTAANPSVDYNSAGSNWTQLVVTDATGCKDTIKKFNYVTIASSATNFTISPLTGCAPFSAFAQTLNSQYATSIAWTCTGGLMSGTNTPDNMIYFDTPGSYQLCLTMQFPGNCQATKCTTIVVKATPVADFTETGIVPTCQPPLTVNYTNASTGIGLTYNWQLPGSGGNSTQASPQNVLYNSCGNYDATLIVTSSNGCKDTLTKQALVNIDCPMASFVPSSAGGCFPLDVTFNSTQSTGSPTQWFWNFGDVADSNAVQSTQQNPSHTYTAAGCYTVRLIIINAQNCKDTLLFHNAVCAGTPPIINFTANPQVTCAGTAIHFTNQTISTPPTTWKWDYIQVPPYDYMGSATNPNYLYQDTGMFDVTLIACNNGCCDTLTKPNYITIKPPIAKILATRTCSAPHTVTFHGNQSIGATSYSWSFPGGNPSTSTDSTVIVNFATTGTYVATLTVYNSVTGCSHTANKTIQIKDIQADFYVSDTAACAPHTFCFYNTSQDGNTYKWYFYNQTGALYLSSTAISPCLSFGVPGIYSVKLIATDVNGCKDTLYKPNLFSVYGVQANFYGTPTQTGCVPLLVNFLGTALASVTSTPVSYQWNFGDVTSGINNFATTVNASHTYSSQGTFNVVFSVIDNHGCVTTVSQPDYIHAEKPDADFTSVDSSVCLGSPVCFTNQTNGIQPVTYGWLFGDGSPVNNQLSPCHQYADTGIYSVTLFATDSWGCKDTIVKPLYASVISPQANFTADTTTTTCPPLAVNFSNTSTGIDTGAQYFWDLGDGATSTAQNPFHIYTTPGAYDVTLVVTTVDGCQDTLFMDDFINIFGPVATVSVTPKQGCNPLHVSFQASSANSILYTWDFGDGTVTAGLDTISHNYNQDGTFYPQIILNDGVGCVYSFPLDTITVATPEASYTASPYYLCQNGLVQFTNTSTSEQPITQYSWNFGDIASGANNTSSSINPSHQFGAVGNYLVSLSVTNSFGCTSVYIDTIFVTGGPQATFTMSDSTICPGTTVTFTNTSVNSTPITSYSWNFGDPASGASNTSTQLNGSHTYNIPGTYTVTMTITAITGCVNSTQHTVTVYSNPNANAGPDKSICIGNSTAITASGGTSYAWTPYTTLSASTGATVTANPTNTTTYILSVTDVNGCSSSDAVTVTVNPLPIVNAGNNISICPGVTTPLNAAGASTYQWSPSSGLNQTNIANPTTSTTVNTTYVVIGTTAAGCSSSDSVVVTVYTSPIANAGSDQTICYGDSAQLNGSGGATYSWSPANTLTSSSNATTKAFPTLTTTYTLTVYSVNNCQAIDNVVVTVNALPIANAGPDKSICIGNSTTITASGGTVYSWTPYTTLSNSTGASVTANPTTTTTYTVSVTNVNGCSSSDAVKVTVNPLPIVNAGSDITICPGVATPMLATGAATYQWSPSAGLNQTNIANPTTSTTVNTTYAVIGTTAAGCSSTDTVLVNVFSAALANAGTDQTVCYGDTAQLTGSGGVAYSWSPSNTLLTPFDSSTKAFPTQTTTYTLTVYSSNNCQATDDVIVTVNPLPNVDAGADQTICQGNVASLQATGAIQFQWQSDPTLTATNISNPTAIPAYTQSYFVVGTDANGCSNKDTVVVNVVLPFKITVDNGAEVCEGEVVQLNASGGASYIWSPASSLDNPYVASPYASPTQSTIYKVVAYDGMCFKDSGLVSVIVNPLPDAYAGEDQMILAGETISLNASGNGTYSWSPSVGLSCTDCATVDASPGQTTDYILTVTNGFGCMRYDSITVMVGCKENVVFIPNAFTPNGDGQNDFFLVRSKGLRKLDYMRIFDRWGNMIYESSDASEGWDGKYNNKPVMPGTYVYYMQATCSNGQSIMKQGNVTLIR